VDISKTQVYGLHIYKMDQEYKTVCNKCLQGTWYETEQPCKQTLWQGCKKCGSHEVISKEKLCTGTLIVIDNSDLASQFSIFYKNKQRIEVQFSYGDMKRGTVGKTTGWKPVYLLMLKRNSTASAYTLSDAEKIVKVIS